MAIARLALVAGYSLLLLSVDAMHFEAQVDGVLIGLVGVGWLVILGTYWRGLARAASKRDYALAHLGTPLLLIAPLARQAQEGLAVVGKLGDGLLDVIHGQVNVALLEARHGAGVPRHPGLCATTPAGGFMDRVAPKIATEFGKPGHFVQNPLLVVARI